MVTQLKAAVEQISVNDGVKVASKDQRKRGRKAQEKAIDEPKQKVNRWSQDERARFI